MDIEVKLDKAKYDEVRNRLAHLPRKARFALTNAIRYALRRGRTQALRLAGERYHLGSQYSQAYRWALRAMGNVRMSGTTGFVHVRGSKIPLMLFPHQDFWPIGTEIYEMTQGSPMIQKHVFGREAWHRKQKGAPRYPIFHAVGLATAQMVGQATEVQPKLEKSITADLYKELNRLMEVALAGGFATPSSQ